MIKPTSTPFSTRPLKPQKISVPADLATLVNASADILRLSHPDYPQGMRADNVKTHTLRLVRSALTLALPAKFEPLRPSLIRTVWLHDLPEVPNAATTGQDVSAVSQHDDPSLAHSVEAAELQAARHLFSATDLKLYTNFEAARHLLSGHTTSVKPISPESLIARILDIGDGETGFYYFLAAWIRDPDFDGSMPTSRPYEFTLARYGGLQDRLPRLGLDPLLVDICRGQIKDQIEFIVRNLQPILSRLPPAGRRLAKGL